MAIQPIDLQTLFTQMDKVGKSQIAQREGAAIQHAIQGVQIQRKMEEHIQSVNETQNTGDDGAEKVKDRPAQKEGKESGDGKKKENRRGNPEEEDIPVISDPRLGRNIDISL